VNFEISEGERKIAISLLEPEIDFYNKAVELFKQ
jgi:predicted HTH domain antitoxin